MEKNTGGLTITQSFLILLTLILILIISSLLTRLLIGDTDLRSLVNYLITFGISLFAAIKIYEKHAEKYRLNLSFKHLKLVPIVLLLPVLLQFGLTSHLVDLMPMPDLVKQMFYDMGSNYSWEMVVMIVIFAPVLEEILCRGVILKGLLNRYTPLTAIVVSSLIFGLMHLNPWQFIGAFGIGMINGWLFWKTESILLPIIVHFANNLLFTFFSLYFGTAFLVDKPLREVFGNPVNQVLGVITSLTLLCAILYFLKQKFRMKKISTPGI